MRLTVFTYISTQIDTGVKKYTLYICLSVVDCVSNLLQLEIEFLCSVRIAEYRRYVNRLFS